MKTHSYLIKSCRPAEDYRPTYPTNIWLFIMFGQRMGQLVIVNIQALHYYLFIYFALTTEQELRRGRRELSLSSELEPNIGK